MPVSARALGAELGPRTVAVSTRAMLAFAAAIGETGSATFDDAGPEPLVAVPAFCVTLEWPVLSSPARADVLGLTPVEMRRAVHVEQDSTFHRVIRVDDHLVTRATIAGIRATRAGALVRTRLTTVDAATGAPVVTTQHAVMYRGVGVDGETVSSTGDRSQPGDPGAELPAIVPIAIARELAHVYTECAGIWNPIHSERRAALDAGLPDVILHGTATWALAGREIVRACAGGRPARLKRLRGWFAAPVVPGTSITLHHSHPTREGILAFMVRDADGRAVVTDGVAEIAPAATDRT